MAKGVPFCGALGSERSLPYQENFWESLSPETVKFGAFWAIFGLSYGGLTTGVGRALTTGSVL